MKKEQTNYEKEKFRNGSVQSNEANMMLDFHENNLRYILQSLGSATLTKVDLQILIDFLLNKQQDCISIKDPTEWIDEKTDDLQRIKKQLHQKDVLLKEEQRKLASCQVSP